MASGPSENCASAGSGQGAVTSHQHVGGLSTQRSRDSKLLFWSQSASVIGDALVIVAIGLFVPRLTGRTSDVGLVLGAYSGPLCDFVLFGRGTRLPATATPRHGHQRPRPCCAARDARRADRDRKAPGLAHDRHRAALRKGGGLLPPRLHRSGPADGSGGPNPAGPNPQRADAGVAEIASPMGSLLLPLSAPSR